MTVCVPSLAFTRSNGNRTRRAERSAGGRASAGASRAARGPSGGARVIKETADAGEGVMRRRRWQNDAKRRYYTVDIVRDLFGQ